jgi:hypothetical protein
MRRSVAVFLCAFVAASGLRAADLSLKVEKKEAPAELDPSIRKAFQSEALQLLDAGKPTLEFWFSNEVPLTTKPDSSAGGLQAIKQTTLIGAVAVHKGGRDYRENDLNTGVYTMRFALQPQDGNHLGTAEYLSFIVLIPAKLDTKLDGIPDYKAMVKASSKETSNDHPVVLSLRPSSSTEGDFPKLAEPAPEHKSIRVKLPAKAAGSDKASLVFELVYEGKGKI